jgi:hypothetical protein
LCCWQYDNSPPIQNDTRSAQEGESRRGDIKTVSARHLYSPSRSPRIFFSDAMVHPMNFRIRGRNIDKKLTSQSLNSPSALGPKKGNRTIAPKKASLIKQQKMNKVRTDTSITQAF